MKTLYANAFSVSSNGNNEIFLQFDLSVPQYNTNGEYEKQEIKKSVLICLSGNGYASFKQMLLDNQKEEQANDSSN